MTQKKTTAAKAPAFKNTDILGRRVDQQEYERFVALAKDLGLESLDLEGRVRELCEEIAEGINGPEYGGGLEEQARFLVNEDGDWEQSLRLIARSRRPVPRKPAKSRKKAAAPAKKAKKP